MDPLTLSLIMGGGTALNEMTTGNDKKTRDAILKATAYRMRAYDKGINPEGYDVYQPNPLGKGISAGGGAYQLASQIKQDKAITDFLNAKGAQAGGKGASIADAASVGGLEDPNFDAPPNEDYFRDTHGGVSNWKEDSGYNRLARARMMGRIG